MFAKSVSSERARERERKSANDKESCSVCMPETEENPIFIRQVNIEAANGGCMEYKYPPISHLLKCKCYWLSRAKTECSTIAIDWNVFFLFIIISKYCVLSALNCSLKYFIPREKKPSRQSHLYERITSISNSSKFLAQSTDCVWARGKRRNENVYFSV